MVVLVIPILVSGLSGCEKAKDKSARGASSEIKKLLNDELASRPPEAREQFVAHFNNIPLEIKKQHIKEFVRRMASPTPQETRPKAERLQHLKNRLMNIPPEKRGEAFRTLSQKHPELAQELRRQFQPRPGQMGKQGGCPDCQKKLQQRGPGGMKQQQWPMKQPRQGQGGMKMKQMTPGLISGFQAFKENSSPEEREGIKNLFLTGLQRFKQLPPKEREIVLNWELSKLEMLFSSFGGGHKQIAPRPPKKQPSRQQPKKQPPRPERPRKSWFDENDKDEMVTGQDWDTPPQPPAQGDEPFRFFLMDIPPIPDHGEAEDELLDLDAEDEIDLLIDEDDILDLDVEDEIDFFVDEE